MSKQQDKTPPNLRALRIKEILADAGRALSATEINEHLGLPKATVYRLCSTLEASGFLTRDTHRGRLRPARRLRRIGGGVLATSRIHVARQAVMERVARHIGETLNLAVPEEQGMSYVDRVDTQWPLRFQLPVGSHVPFHCTASGKLFLSAYGDPELAVVLRALELAPEGPNCITEADALFRELQAIRGRGHSFDNKEFMAGMIAAAIPVRTPSGFFLAPWHFMRRCSACPWTRPLGIWERYPAVRATWSGFCLWIRIEEHRGHVGMQAVAGCLCNEAPYGFIRAQTFKRKKQRCIHDTFAFWLYWPHWSPWAPAPPKRDVFVAARLGPEM